MRSRYDVMTTSDIRDTDGQNYPDPISFPANNFYAEDNTIKVVLSDQDIKNPYKLVNKIYAIIDFDDMIFWLNNIEFYPDLEAGEELELPSLFSLENFILENRNIQ